MKNYRFPQKGFTMVEMLLVTSLIAVIGLAIFHSLVNGIKIWEVSITAAQEENVVIFFDKISQDLHNATDSSLIKLSGGKNRMNFVTLVRTLADPVPYPQPDYISQIGRVEYEFDPLRNALLRRQANYSQSLDKKFGPARLLLEEAQFVHFSYYFMESDRLVVRDFVPDGQWPVSVLLEVGFSTGKSSKLNTMSKLISIPSGNSL